jgi:cell wall-associated NlpC family hydrolase
MTLNTVSSINPVDLSPAEFRQYKVICAALYCFYNAGQLFYSNVRGKGLSDQFHPPPFIPGHLDCSSFVHWCFAVSGCQDPSGGGTLGSAGGDFQGDTGTLWVKGRFIGGSDVKSKYLLPGDVIFYSDGPSGAGLHGGNSEHCALYIADGKVISMGSDEGPLKLPYNESSKALYGARRYEF